MKKKELLEAISARLEHARIKDPLFAYNRAHAVDVIGEKIDDFEYAVEFKGLDRQKDAALDIIAVFCRFVLEDWWKK